MRHARRASRRPRGGPPLRRGRHRRESPRGPAHRDSRPRRTPTRTACAPARPRPRPVDGAFGRVDPGGQPAAAPRARPRADRVTTRSEAPQLNARGASARHDAWAAARPRRRARTAPRAGRGAGSDGPGRRSCRAEDRGEMKRVLPFAPRRGAIATSRPCRSPADEVLGQVPPAEPRAEHRVLGVEVGDAPGARREHGLVGDAGVAPLREDDLHAPRSAPWGSCPCAPRAGGGAHDRDHPDAARAPGARGPARRRAGCATAERRRAVEHARRDRGHDLRVDAQVDRGNSFANAGAEVERGR